MGVTRCENSTEPRDPMAGDPNVQVPPTMTNPSMATRPPSSAQLVGTFTTEHGGYAGETGSGVGNPSIDEPHVDLGDDTEFARLREAVGQV
uniref:Uncharacterized protein n=1 Tax=Cannabis sativa TaxID=3483 RepID=A0A803NM83_CANSA